MQLKNKKKSNQTKKSGDVSHRSIGTVIMIMFLVVIVTSLSVLGYISYWTGTNMLKNNFKSMTGELLGTVEHATVRYLNQFEFIVEYLSKDSNVLSVDTYADSEPWLIKVLDNVLDSQSDVLNVYYAPDAGGFYVRPASELPEGFDPRVRPWYEDAKKRWRSSCLDRPVC